MKREGLTLLALLLAGSASARDLMMEEVTLTASRLPQEVARSGVSVSVLTAEDLERAGDVQLIDFLARLPGLSTVQSGSEGTLAAVSIRGADPRYIAVFIDGVKVNDPSGIGGEFDFGALSTADISRVEVLRGAQGALWGSQAMGGVIHITSRASAGAGGQEQSFGIEGGSRGQRALRYRSAWQAGDMEAAISLSHRAADGFSAMNTLPETPDAERDGFEANRLSFSTRYRVTEDLSLGVTGFHQRTLVEHDDPWGGGMNARAQAGRRETGGQVFAELQSGSTAHRFELGLYRIRREIWQAGDYGATRRSLSWQAVTTLREGLSFVYGLEASRETALFSGIAAGDDSRTAALWGQALWSPATGFDVTASLRRDDHSRFGGKATGRLAFAYALSPEVTLRGVAATGFLSPSLYQLYGDEWVRPNPALQPEDSRSAELGVDYSFSGGSLGLTLFRLDSDNAILWGTDGYVNVPGRSRRQGGEMTLRYALGSAWELDAGYSYTDARRATGERLGRIPRHQLSLGVSGAVTERLTLRAGLRATADRPEDDGQEMGSFALLSLGAGYAVSEATRIDLRVENLLDRQYQTVAGYASPRRGVFLGLNTRF